MQKVFLPPSDEGGARRAEGENFLSDVIYHTSLPHYFTIRTINVGEGLRALPKKHGRAMLAPTTILQ